MSKTKRNEPYKERKPIPRTGVRFTDRKKQASKRACRKGNW